MRMMSGTGSYRVCKQFSVRRLVIATPAAELQLILRHAAFLLTGRQALCIAMLSPSPAALPTLFKIFLLPVHKSSATRKKY
jgi:hypothetical protein